MRFVVILLLVSAGLSSCNYFIRERVRGDGNIASQTISVDSFRDIDASGAFTIRLRQDASSSVRVETDRNLIEYLDIYTKGNRLVIDTKRKFNLRPTREIIVYVTAPQFRDIEVSGACNIRTDAPVRSDGDVNISVSGSSNIMMDLSAPRINTDLSGSTTLQLRGTAREFISEASGSSEIRCFELLTENTSLDLSGASDAEVSASRMLDVEASGASNVVYTGNADVKSHTSGAGSVKKRG
ncbi:MAG TPA: head GIN domain-containing protein [Flavisolibacter sp.]